MIFAEILPMLPIIAVGYFFKKKGILPEYAPVVLNKILFNFVVPILVLGAFAKIEITTDIVLLPLAGVIAALLFLIIGIGIGNILIKKQKTRASFVIAFSCFEGGTITYPLVSIAFGAMGLSRAVLYDFGLGLILVTILYALAQYYGEEKSKLNLANAGCALKQLTKSPIIWGIATGIIFNLLNVQGAFFDNLYKIVGGSILVLAMLLIGLELNPSIKSLQLVLATMVLKMIVGLGVALLISLVFGFTGLEKNVVLIATTVPASFLALIYARENNLDTEFTASLLSISYPVSIVVLSFLINYLL
ncbi:AEC family transporter [Patescibacteria group bacterium]|nr:AEC family transporter [Patescibacteria group bacterium]